MKETLSFNEYQERANELMSEEAKKEPLLNGVLGLTGEAGECADLYKKYLFQGHPFDKEKMVKELGDVLWYIAEVCKGLGVSLEEVAKTNLDKLYQRYHGHTFSASGSIHRDDKD